MRHARTRCRQESRSAGVGPTSGKNRPPGRLCGPQSISYVYAMLAQGAKCHLADKLMRRDGMLAYLNKQGSFHRYRTEPRFVAWKELGLPPIE